VAEMPEQLAQLAYAAAPQRSRGLAWTVVGLGLALTQALVTAAGYWQVVTYLRGARGRLISMDLGWQQYVFGVASVGFAAIAIGRGARRGALAVALLAGLFLAATVVLDTVTWGRR
jgi:hypothetical protein